VTKVKNCCFGGVIVSVLAIGSEVCGFKPGQDNGFLIAIKICSMPSFAGEVKLETPCQKILQNVKKSLGKYE
jgi:hypothetical protein